EEPVQADEPSVEPLQAEEAVGAPAPAKPIEDRRSLTVVDPLPARFVFEAGKENGQPITLTGAVPAAATAAYYGVIAGGVPTDALAPQAGLPDDFISSGIAGLRALVQVNEGRLGFDGARWWLRGMVEDASLRDTLTTSIEAL